MSRVERGIYLLGILGSGESEPLSPFKVNFPIGRARFGDSRGDLLLRPRRKGRRGRY